MAAVRPHIVWPRRHPVGGTRPGSRQSQSSAIARRRRCLIDTTYVDNAASAIVAALHRMEHVHGKAVVVSNGEPPAHRRAAGRHLLSGSGGPRRRGLCRAVRHGQSEQ